MFRPQPSPYTPAFAAYGATRQHNTGQDDYQFQSSPLALGGPIIFDHPIFAPAGFAGLAMDTPPNDDLVAQEALARQYQPELKGPLVGDRTSSQAIAEEYAKADPVYVAKTSNLPQQYSHYRPVRGDGNCGWRAIAFCYFETLLRLGSKERIDSECDRMATFANFIIRCRGHTAWIFEDMKEEVLSLLREIGEIIHLGPQSDVNSLILQRFNDQSVSDSIIYYFRLLSSAWLKAHEATYQGFIPDMRGIDDFIKDVLEPSSAEIDHLGMTLLVDALLKPIGISVEIVYLDRSEGPVNSHIMESPNTSQGGALIHLLYRPGHYDILYKEVNRSPPRPPNQQTIPVDATPVTDLRVNRVTAFSHQHQVQGTAMGNFPGADMSVLTSLPQLFGGPLHSFGEPYSSVPAFDPDPTPASVYQIDSPVSSLPPGPGVYSNVPSSMSMASPLMQTHSPLHLRSLPTDAGPASPTGSQFRPSKYEYQQEWSEAGQTQTFLTSTFKNSHYNTAHYNNPNFQPEAYVPESDEATGKGRR